MIIYYIKIEKKIYNNTIYKVYYNRKYKLNMQYYNYSDNLLNKYHNDMINWSEYIIYIYREVFRNHIAYRNLIESYNNINKKYIIQYKYYEDFLKNIVKPMRSKTIEYNTESNINILNNLEITLSYLETKYNKYANYIVEQYNELKKIHYIWVNNYNIYNNLLNLTKQKKIPMSFLLYNKMKSEWNDLIKQSNLV